MMPDVNQTYFIFNKRFNGRINISDNVERLYLTQRRVWEATDLWFLEAEPKHPGFFYLKSLHEGYRITKGGRGDDVLSSFRGNYFDDQLWRFQKEGEYYRLFNFYYPDAQLAQPDDDTTHVHAFSHGSDENRLWKFVPRYVASIETRVLWSCDNRKGSEAFQQTIEITKGIKMLNCSSIRAPENVRKSLKIALMKELGKLGKSGSEMEKEFTSEINNSTLKSEEQDRQRNSVTLSAPAGKKYQVIQNVCTFKSVNTFEDCEISTGLLIEESDNDLEYRFS
ncbi:uncharacterized protein LOC130623973 [Hydractinia symbiolongicarpus]|uniref:uncharacterized protein LOC130623973 n=1 Tax=Hydractinia symbiolongicarpus TaxID=13093 RepID=UPI00254AC52E|nr:uncharacterized protein LOC130623973 [Hydractinia symbiolongicarpus]